MLVILTGKSASGKDTLAKELTSHHGYIPIISETSRPIRPGEREGVEYHFVSKTQFLKDIKENRMIEYRSYKTAVNGKSDVWYYGTPAYKLMPDKKYIAIVDLEGAKVLQEHYKNEEHLTVYIEAPDLVRKKRAMERNGFDEIEWDRRAKDDAKKFSFRNIEETCNVVIKNELPDKRFLVREFMDVIDAFRSNEIQQEVMEDEYEK